MEYAAHSHTPATSSLVLLKRRIATNLEAKEEHLQQQIRRHKPFRQDRCFHQLFSMKKIYNRL